MTLDHSDFPSFGTMLKAWRTRKHLTQQQLAERLGVRRNTIGTWERGDFLPGSKGIVLELARFVCQNEQETRHLLEASLTALSPYFLVPFQRNPFFTGREEILNALHAHLGAEQVVALTQSYALHGLGGIGKTQIALEYVYRHTLDYRAVFWIGAETSENIISSLLHIAEVLQLPGRDDKDQQRVVAEVQHWLTTHSQWLLIWDNVEDLDVLPRFLPTAHQGAILLTTRRSALGTLARGLFLLPMEQEEGMLFLLRRAKAVEPEATRAGMQQFAVQMPDQYAAAEQLVRTMGGLPLALDQAGAYIEEVGCSLAGYLQRYQQERWHLLARRGEVSSDHPHSVVVTLGLACRQAAQHSPAVLELLRCCAFLYPDAIPEEFFLAGADHVGPVLGPVVADRFHFDGTLATLRRFSLVQNHPETRTLSLHRLVQVILQEEMSEQERAEWQLRVVRLLNAVFPTITDDAGRTHAWEPCERLLPHVMHCSAAIPAHLQNQELADLLLKAGEYLDERFRNEAAESLFRQVIRIQEQILGREHPKVASVQGYLANCYRVWSNYRQAEPLYQSAVRVLEQTLGSDHPEVATHLSGLARVYEEQGKYELAEPVQQRALRIQEQAFGLEHPEVASSLSYLGLVHAKQGKYEQAELVLQRALRIREHTLGPEHFRVVGSLNNLGVLYREQGKYEQAERFCLRAVRLAEQVWAAEDPSVAYTLNTLAQLYGEWGKYEMARPLYQRALALYEQTFGPEHARIADPVSGLALVCREQGNAEQAESLFRRALQIHEQHQGRDHPTTAQVLYEMALFREKQGHLDEAISLAERALQIRSQSLGDDHPHTVASRTLYAQLLEKQTGAQEDVASEQSAEEIPDSRGEERHVEKSSLLLRKTADPSSSENDPLQAFLDACCELHPRAWCCSADLWGTYERWVAEHQERFPLSRRAFTMQLKAHGCSADRTETARIWRGITIAPKAAHQKLTEHDAT